jgi:RNA polymerase sigma-70 factor (ECF subfamily)
MIRPVPPEAIARAIQGDRQAFRVIVENHQSFAYAVAYRMVGNRAEAEDIAQEAFIRLWKNISKYRTDVKLSTWLYKIVTNLCLDFLKSPHNRQREHHHGLEHAGDVQTITTPDSILAGKELRLEIEKATETLPPLQKAVFVLRDLESLSVAETCEILSLTADKVKSNLFHARKNIAERLFAYKKK